MTRKILIFAAVIIGIIVDYYVACEFQHIAMEKGFSDRKYFWYTFLLGMIGILMIVFTFRRIIICSGRVCVVVLTQVILYVVKNVIEERTILVV